MPRNRTVSLAVVRSSFQRAAGSASPSARSRDLKRRIVLGVLVLASLVLITASLRSSALVGAESATASILRPFEVAAQRVSHPFRDAIGWTGALFHQTSENAKLKRQNAELRNRLVLDQVALQQSVALRDATNFRGPPTLADFRRITALVLEPVQSVTDQSVVISAGSSAKIRRNDVVVSPNDDLVGVVTKVYGNESRVRLVTDGQSHVAATDLRHPSALGIITRGPGGNDSLILDRVEKSEAVHPGDMVITAGSFGHGRLPSIYPRGLPIGIVESATNSDVAPFKQIAVKPLAHLSSLWTVSILVPKTQP